MSLQELAGLLIVPISLFFNSILVYTSAATVTNRDRIKAMMTRIANRFLPYSFLCLILFVLLLLSKTLSVDLVFPAVSYVMYPVL